MYDDPRQSPHQSQTPQQQAPPGFTERLEPKPDHGEKWTPLIPSTMPKDLVAKFGKNAPLGRAGQPAELAPAYVLLASAVPAT